MKLLLVILVSVASTFAFASQRADDVVVECVETVKVGFTCKALTFSCIGGYDLKVNGHSVKTFVSGRDAESACSYDKDLALEVIDAVNSEPKTNEGEFVCQQIISCMPPLLPGDDGRYCSSAYPEWEKDNCVSKAMISH